MCLELSLEEIIDILDGRLAVGMMSESVGAVSTDTRNGAEGCWFLCLPGEKFDGHDYIGEAFSLGALGCIVNERTGYPIASTGFPLVAVPDTRAALVRLARNWRRRLNYKVILVIDDDRDRSGFITDAVSEMLKSSGTVKRLDLRYENEEDCLVKLISFGVEDRFLVVNFFPGEIETGHRILEALCPDFVCGASEDGKLFRYFRITSSSTDIDGLCGAVFDQLQEREGVFLAGTAISIPERNQGLTVLSGGIEAEDEPQDEKAANRLAEWFSSELKKRVL